MSRYMPKMPKVPESWKKAAKAFKGDVVGLGDEVGG